MTLTLNYSNGDKPVDRFLELACLTYGRDHEDRRVEAQRLLAADPTLASQNIFTLCCAGDVNALKQLITSGNIDVNAEGGPMNWPPLLYACYSRIDVPGGSTLDVAGLLLERDADPNAHYMWGGQYRFTALTGAFGEGESGPRQQPAHPNCETLARLLLEHGADPNDSQALYNRMFTNGSECLRLLLEYGLKPTAKNNWSVKKNGKFESNQTCTLAYQLNWAIEKHHLDRVKLILDTGIDVNQPPEGGNSFLKLAVLNGNSDAEQLLTAAGAVPATLDVNEQFTAACSAGDSETAQRLLDENPSAVAGLKERLPDLLVTAAGANQQNVVECTRKLGVDVNAMTTATALHQAAWHGHLKMAEYLVGIGADLSLRDHTHDATPADWANYSGNHNVAKFLDDCTDNK